MYKYLISYDVSSSEYTSLYKYIQKHTYVHLTESLFAIKSHKTQTQIRDDLVACVSPKSSIFVTQLDGYSCKNPIDGINKLCSFYNN